MLPWPCLDLSLTLLWPCPALTLSWTYLDLAITLHWAYWAYHDLTLTLPWTCLDLDSKMSGLTYKKFQLQEYLISPIFNNRSRNLLFRLRTRTVSGVRNDFREWYPDTTCPLVCGETNTIPNILTWHVCHYYLNTKVLKWAAAIFVMTISFLKIFKNKNKSPNYNNSCCRLEMKLWAYQCHLLVPCIVVIHCKVLH